VSGAVKTRALAAVTLTTGAVVGGFAAATTNQTNLAPVYDIVSDANRVYVAAAGSGGACTALSIADGALVFSKQREGRWPEPQEILQALGAGSSA